MKIATLNVNGIRAASKKGMLDWIVTEDFDIICLQEVRMPAADIETLVPKGYHHVGVAAEKKGYSGVSIWSKEEPLSTQTSFQFPLADNEGRIVKAVFQNCVVYSMYFPSGTTGSVRQLQKYEFLDFLNKQSSSLLDEHRHVLICGDVNIAHTEKDIFHHKANAKKSGFLPEEREWLTSFLASGWVDVFRSMHPDTEEYSWWTNRSKAARPKNIGWRIDYQLASKGLADRAKSSWIVDRSLKLSDHTAVVVEYDI
jgi:exodeoxyribonuclease-3